MYSFHSAQYQYLKLFATLSADSLGKTGSGVQDAWGQREVDILWSHERQEIHI